MATMVFAMAAIVMMCVGCQLQFSLQPFCGGNEEQELIFEDSNLDLLFYRSLRSWPFNNMHIPGGGRLETDRRR